MLVEHLLISNIGHKADILEGLKMSFVQRDVEWKVLMDFSLDQGTLIVEFLMHWSVLKAKSVYLQPRTRIVGPTAGILHPHGINGSLDNDHSTAQLPKLGSFRIT